ncbi:MAG: threonine synthase, partial [Phycisphaeraceae bacterium]|nr:threonine synthase [Phycisphaeraceae bacterium]
LAASQRGAVRRDEPVACLVTGVGFKDPDGVDRMIEGIDCPLIEPSEIDRM